MLFHQGKLTPIQRPLLRVFVGMATLVDVRRSEGVGPKSREPLGAAAIPVVVAGTTHVALAVRCRVAALPQRVAAAAGIAGLGAIVVEWAQHPALGSA